jgi:hypothetical protein
MDLLLGFVQGLVRVVVSYPFDFYRLHRQVNSKAPQIKTLKFFRGIEVPLLTVPIDRSFQFFCLESLQSLDIVTRSLVVALVSNLWNVPMQYLTAHKVIGTTGGARKPYTGFLTAFARNTLMGTMFMASYLYGRDQLGLQSFWNGVAASWVSWTIGYPLDTIRARQQIHNSFRVDLKSLYRGISLVYVRSAPSAGLGMLAYEKTRSWVSSQERS